jgi:hypothetical protein
MYGSRPASLPTPWKYSVRVRLVDAQQLRDVAFALGDLALHLASSADRADRAAPSCPLREPDRFVRAGQVLPVDTAVAGFEERLAFLFEDVTDRPGARVSDAQVRLLVIARRRDERDLVAVRAPLHVDPVAAALDVVAQRRAMLVLIHLEANHFRAVDVDDDALDHRDELVARKRILPCAQRRMPRGRVHEIHLTGLALILLEGRDLLRVRRPLEHRAIAADSSRRCRCVPVIFHAVGRELLVRSRGQVPDPQVPVLDVRAYLPSGDRSLFGTGAGRSADVHCLPWTSQAQRLQALSTRTTGCRQRK